jgi:hypothetical protein
LLHVLDQTFILFNVLRCPTTVLHFAYRFLDKRLISLEEASYVFVLDSKTIFQFTTIFLGQRSAFKTNRTVAFCTTIPAKTNDLRAISSFYTRIIRIQLSIIQIDRRDRRINIVLFLGIITVNQDGQMT